MAKHKIFTIHYHPVSHSVFSNERWFDDKEPDWKYLLLFGRVKEYKHRQITLLSRARRPRKYPLTDTEFGARQQTHRTIAKRIKACGPGQRCGCLACPACRRAFARAQYVAFAAAAKDLQKRYSKHTLMMATLVPFMGLSFKENTLEKLDLRSLQKLFIEEVGRVLPTTPFFGVLEISYEEPVRNRSVASNLADPPYYQPHWHIIWCSRLPRERVMRKLRRIFPNSYPQRQTIVQEIYNLEGCLSYCCKTSEKGWRWSTGTARRAKRNRRTIPMVPRREIARWLARYEPADFIASRYLTPRVTKAGFKLAPCGPTYIPPIKPNKDNTPNFFKIRNPWADWLFGTAPELDPTFKKPTPKTK
jgi:hypothetical protein